MKSFKQFLLIENKEEMINQLNSLFKKENLGSDTLNSYLPLVEEIYARFKGSNLYQFLSTVLKDLILTENGKKAKVKSISKKEFKDLLMELEHFYSYDFIKKHYKLVAKKPYDDVLEELKEKEDEWKKSNPHLIPPDGKKILTFPDGYFWVDLEKSKCDMESEAMGHCGTTNEDETLLSLRKEVKKGNKVYHEPHVTFSLRPDGYLTQMKGKENTKPSEKYHKYIIELLDHSRIKGIKGGGYRPETNFNILDLHPDQWKKIYSKNKNMLGGVPEEYHDLIQKMAERDLTKEEQLEYVKKDPHFIQLFSDTDKDVQIAAVENSESSIINLMKNPTPQVIDFALNNYKWYLPNKKIFNRMNDQQKIKLEQNQIDAVKNDWRTMEHIFINGIKPSEVVQLAAVKHHMPTINIIIGHKVKPSEKVISAAIDEGWYDPPKEIYDKLSEKLKEKIEKNQRSATEKNWWAIRSIINGGYKPSEDVQLAAVKNNWKAIESIINVGYEPSDNVISVAIDGGWYLPPKEIYDKSSKELKEKIEKNQLAAVEYDWWVIKYIIDAEYDISEAVQIAAVKQNKKAILKIIDAEYDLSEAVQLASVKNDWRTIIDIVLAGYEPSEKVQLAAVKQDEKAITVIKNVKDSVIKYVIDNYGKLIIDRVLSLDFESKETKQKLQAAFDEKYK